jgi:hypothetical protein
VTFSSRGRGAQVQGRLFLTMLLTDIIEAAIALIAGAA